MHLPVPEFTFVTTPPPVIDAIVAENKTSMNAIADELNKRGILTPNGGPRRSATF
jgi:hypothetical protein